MDWIALLASIKYGMGKHSRCVLHLLLLCHLNIVLVKLLSKLRCEKYKWTIYSCHSYHPHPHPHPIIIINALFTPDKKPKHRPHFH